MQRRWLKKLGGRPGSRPAGEYDLFVLLAVNFGWSPEQVLDMPVDFIEELLVFLSARERMKKEG